MVSLALKKAIVDLFVLLRPQGRSGVHLLTRAQVPARLTPKRRDHTPEEWLEQEFPFTHQTFWFFYSPLTYRMGREGRDSQIRTARGRRCRRVLLHAPSLLAQGLPVDQPRVLVLIKKFGTQRNL
jgi:hypothetical protein